MNVKPLGDRILIKIKESETKTAGGIIIPQTAQEKTQTGVVVAVGTDKDVIKVKEGDEVMYDKYAGTQIKVQGADHLIVKMADILAVWSKSPRSNLIRTKKGCLVEAAFLFRRESSGREEGDDFLGARGGEDRLALFLAAEEGAHFRQELQVGAGFLERREGHDVDPASSVVERVEIDLVVGDTDAGDELRYRARLAVGNGDAVLHARAHPGLALEHRGLGLVPVADLAALHGHIDQLVNYLVFRRARKMKRDHLGR